MLQSSTLSFLKGLKKNNNKLWFDEHRKDYESAKADFISFIQAVIDKHGKKDKLIATLKAKDCIFRINRDVRFSKDKSPYKTNMGAYINRGGKKSILAGYYFHCEPGEARPDDPVGRAFVGGGIWQPMPPELKKVRQEVDYNLKEFKKIISSKKFKSVYGELYKGADVSLSRVPKGYEENNPAIEYLKLKSFLAMANLSEKDLISKNLLKKTLDAFGALQPLVEFINNSLEP